MSLWWIPQLDIRAAYHVRLHLWLHCRLLASFSTQKGASKVKKTKSSDVTCTKRLSSNILKYVDHASGPARSTSFGHGCHDLCLPRSGCLSSTFQPGGQAEHAYLTLPRWHHNSARQTRLQLLHVSGAPPGCPTRRPL